jgi:hypothetical protein
VRLDAEVLLEPLEAAAQVIAGVGLHVPVDGPELVVGLKYAVLGLLGGFERPGGHPLGVFVLAATRRAR